MSGTTNNSNLEEAFKNSDWSAICAALMPHFNDYLARRSKNVFECEQVNTLDHVSTVPALYDDQAGVRKQVIVPMKVFTRDVDAELEKAKKATTAANTAADKANTAAANADKARTGLEAKKKEVDDAVAASKKATDAAKKATTDTLASKTAIEKNESDRQNAETSRGKAETARANAEASRVGVEKKRVTAESARVSADSKREADTKSAIAKSKIQTDLAKELNEHPPKMGENGNWWRWNLQTHAYEDTGIIARGGAMYPTFRQSRNKLLMIDYGSNVSEHVVKRRNKLVIKV